MSESAEQVYLPDDLLEEILEQASPMSATIQGIFDRIVQTRQQMRDHLFQEAHILNTRDLGAAVRSPSVAAIDGGLAIERSIGADTVLVAAVGVEGLVKEENRHWTGVQYAHWEEVMVHYGGEMTRRFARGVMAALELEILAHAPHDVVILDGSHLTQVIGLNSMLSLSGSAFSLMAAQMLNQHTTAEALNKVMGDKSIVAMVKYDASRELTQSWLSDFSSSYDDRSVMTILLQADEYTRPISVVQTPRARENWENLHITIALSGFPNKVEIQRSLDAGLAGLRSGGIFFTYYKPHAWAPAYRVELKREAAEAPAELTKILQAVKEQVLSPEIREPYPQYLADMIAKSVSNGMRALQAAVFYQLSNSQAGEYLQLITQSYRTEV